MAVKTVASELAALNGPFTKIARAMSRHWNVRIIPSGSRCDTDGATIHIPYTADYLPEEKRQALHGMLDHEVAHVTEEREHREAGRTTPLTLVKRVSTRTIRMMFNVFEDIRIERKYADRFPGVAENLDAANRDSVELHRKRTAAGTKRNFWRMFGCAIILKARGYEVDCLPAEVVTYLSLVVDEIEAIRRPGLWGEDSLTIAKRAYDKVKGKAAEAKEESKASEESEEPEEGEASDESEEGEEEGEASDDVEEGEASDDVEEGEEDGEEGEESEESEEPEESEEDGDGKAPSPEGGETDEDDIDATDDVEEGDESIESDNGEEEADDNDNEAFQDAADDVLDQEADADDLVDELKDDIQSDVEHDVKSHGRYVPNPAVQALDSRTIATASDSGMHIYETARADIRDQIGALKAKQLALLQTIARKQIRSGKDRGDVDAAALASVRLGEKRVFTNVVKGRTLDTAIMVLIDLSGSMGSNRNVGNAAYYALRTAIALAEAWDSLGVASEFMGFYNQWARHSRATPGTINRCPFVYPVFKTFNERLAKCRARFAEINGCGDNADGEAVWAAAKLLAQRPEKRKILMVISDGMPAHMNIEEDVLNAHLREVVKLITSAGIEVFGIGAGTNVPAKFYNNHTGASHLVIKDLRTMAAQVFKAMRDRVMKGVA